MKRCKYFFQSFSLFSCGACGSEMETWDFTKTKIHRAGKTKSVE
jgi:hypothetical protein